MMSQNDRSGSLDPKSDPGTDYLVRALALGGAVRAVAVRSTGLCEEARGIHRLSPIATAALGRLMTGVLMMTLDLEKKDDSITAIIRSDGPIEGMTVIGQSVGRVRGLVREPIVPTTYSRPGKLDVGSAVGKGQLTIVRDLGLKEPYVGQVDLVSGEIAEDLTAYLSLSEQIPTALGLGVLLDQSGVRQAGGFMVQLLPDASDAVAEHLEQRVAGFPEVSYLMEEGFNPHQILDLLLGDPEIQYTDVNRCSYHCPCSREGMERSLVTLGSQELSELAADPDGIHLACHFCSRTYHFTQEEVLHLISPES